MVRASLIGLLSVLSSGAAYVAPAPAQTPAALSAPAAAGPKPAQPPKQPPVPRKVRDVTPAGITPGPAVTGPLVRVRPPFPLPRQPRPPRTERIYHPMVMAAGVIKARGRDIALAGVDAPAFAAECGDGAAAWPCGRMARAALRRFIRGRAVECVIPRGAEEIPSPAECSVGGESLSQWLVAQGWAEPADEAYAGMGVQAREARLGIWSENRPGAQPDAQAGGGAPESAPDNAAAIRARVSGTP